MTSQEKVPWMLVDFQDNALSDSARDLRQLREQSIGSIWRNSQSSAFRIKLLEELYAIAQDCGSDGWDGYNALAVDFQTFACAVEFIREMPNISSLPELSADPDGDVSFDWHFGNAGIASIAVDGNHWLHYAVTIGPRRFAGRLPKSERFPSQVQEILGAIRSGASTC